MRLPNGRPLMPLLLFPLLVPMLFMNCSKPKADNYLPAQQQGPPDPGGGDSSGTIVPLSNDNFQVLANGTIRLNQDKEFKYSPADGAEGTYTISALPSWATFDANTGTISGVAHRLSDSGTFTISKAGEKPVNYGPFNVSVAGDPLLEQQWHLINLGQTGFALNTGVSGEDIHYRTAVKNNILGKGIRVAVSDTGTVIAHPDLSPNVLLGESRNYFVDFNALKSWLGDPTPAATDPGDAHGTAVAGLLAAKGWNNLGGRGVAPEAKLAAFLFLPAQEVLINRNLLNVGLQDQFAGNFDVFNYSWGDPQCALVEYPAAFHDKVQAGVTQIRGGKGAIYVVAGGNSFGALLSDCYANINPANSDFVFGNTNFSELNTTPYMITVAAMSADGLSASYSTPGSALWVSAPGGEGGWSTTNPQSRLTSEPALVTTDYPGCNNGLKFFSKDKSSFDAGVGLNNDCLYTNTMNGTSGATPVVSGVVAMLLQANPNLTWRDVKYILAKTADVVEPNVNPASHWTPALNLTGHVYELPWITNAAGFHFHNWFGFGRVNADNAVALAKAYTFPLGTLQMTNWKHDSGAINAQIPDASAAGLTQTVAVTETLKLEAVQMRLSISNCIGEMGVELVSPSGTRSILMNINSKLVDGAMTDHRLLTNAFLGESSAGTWTLKVIDGKTGCTARLTNWSLNFLGH